MLGPSLLWQSGLLTGFMVALVMVGPPEVAVGSWQLMPIVVCFNLCAILIRWVERQPPMKRK